MGEIMSNSLTRAAAASPPFTSLRLQQQQVVVVPVSDHDLMQHMVTDPLHLQLLMQHLLILLSTNRSNLMQHHLSNDPLQPFPLLQARNKIMEPVKPPIACYVCEVCGRSYRSKLIWRPKKHTGFDHVCLYCK